MWYISFHGGPPPNNNNGTTAEAKSVNPNPPPPPINNIYVYDDKGQVQSPPGLLPTGGSNPALQELRGFGFYNNNYNDLYVINAYQGNSQVLLYQLIDGNYVYSKVFAEGPNVNSIIHPYDLCFDGSGNMYLSSQDSNVVTQLDTSGAPCSSPSALQNYKNLLSGTFVASAVGGLPKLSPPYPDNVPKPLGLTVSYAKPDDKKVQNSVRGVLCWEDAKQKSYLFVCDEPDSKVKIYDVATGDLHAEIAGKNLDKPVQLLLSPQDHHLYITSSGNGSVVRVDISNGIPKGTIAPETFIDGQVDHISGISFDASGNFYAAERKKQRVLQFPPDGSGSGTEFITGLTDDPEFIMYVPNGD